jgi:hypothetical protein
MHTRRHSSWVEGDAADPWLALLAMLIVGVIAAGIGLLLVH